MTVVVADTSIYVSALVFGGVPQEALIKVLAAPFSIAVSEEIKAELTETLTRKFGWPDMRVAEACRYFVDQCALVRARCRSGLARS